MPKRPHKWVFKFWGSDSDGYMYDLNVYQPTTYDKVSDLGRSAGVVEEMTNSLTDGKNFKAFADNYFSSVALAEKLKKQQIYYTRTVKINCVAGNNLPDKKEMEKKGQGHYVSQVERKTNVICTQ
jgi:hypothetical protein